MVENSVLNPLESISLVKEYFETNLSEFKLGKETTHMGYWWIEYFKDTFLKVCFDGDIGGHFSIKVIIEDKEYFLWQFDRSVNKATLSTKQNILFQLKVLKRFLADSI